MGMWRVILGGVVAFALGIAAFVPGNAQAPASLLIRGATIIDGIADAPLTGRALLIEGGVVRDILPANAPAPAGAQVIDLNGKFILPGLIDSHVHWEEWMGELYVNHGVTSVVALDDVPKTLRTTKSRVPRFAARLSQRRPSAVHRAVDRCSSSRSRAHVAQDRARHGELPDA